MNIIRITICTLIYILLAAGNSIAGMSTIRIIHVNDFHGFAEPHKSQGSGEFLGGIAWLGAEVEKLRREKPSLLLAAGDMISGNTWANLFHGESVIELMNLMGFDAMTVGNHEFDYGPVILKKRVTNALFPVLGANVNGLDLLKPYVIKELAGLRIAIIGVVTEDTPFTTHPRNVKGLKFEPVLETVKKYLPELRRKADIVVVLSHIGFAVDRTLAEQVPGIDVIVGGHSHTKVEKPATVGPTIIVQAWEHGKALGVLDLTVEDGKLAGFNGWLVAVKPGMGEPDRIVQALVDKYQRRVDAALDGYVGKTEVDLDGENVRKRETNLGDLVADIVRFSAGGDAAILNGGAIRAGIKKGAIRVKDIYSALPFDNYIVAVRLTGEQIRRALEHGVSSVDSGSGAFPQVSGISFSYSRAAVAGKRVREIFVNGKPVDPRREYIVATNDFLVAGGDGYTVFGDAIGSSRNFTVTAGTVKGGKIAYSDPSELLRDLVVEYVKERRIIAPQTEGRIKEVR